MVPPVGLDGSMGFNPYLSMATVVDGDFEWDSDKAEAAGDGRGAGSLRNEGSIVSRATKRQVEREVEPVRVLGRGLRAQRGVHLTMRTLREAAGKTQIEVAEASMIDQGDISRLESRGNLAECQVSTLQRYVAALGGQLELVAAFGNKKIILSGATQANPTGDVLPAKGSPSNR